MNVSAGQIVRGLETPVGVDQDNARKAVLYFPPGTQFTNFTPAPGPLAVQVTEYTVADSVRRMPGDLPPTSGYTYAFEVGFPAAAAAGIADVTFDRDVAIYVDNFTSAPVGETVPLGYYDRTQGAWRGERSGRVIKVSPRPSMEKPPSRSTAAGSQRPPSSTRLASLRPSV